MLLKKPTVALTATSNSDPITVDNIDGKEQPVTKSPIETSKPPLSDAVPLVVTIAPFDI